MGVNWDFTNKHRQGLLCECLAHVRVCVSVSVSVSVSHFCVDNVMPMSV